MISWQLLLALGLGVFTIRFTGLLAPAGADLPPAVRTIAETMPLAIVSALVFVQIFTTNGAFALDLRAAGLLVAVTLAARGVPLALVVIVTVTVTSLLRFFLG